MILFRFEFKEGQMKYPHTGIIAGLREFLDRDEGLALIEDFEDDLPRPPIELDRNGVYPFFKQEGVDRFKDSIANIIDESKKYGKDVISIVKDSNDVKILYEDQYQVLVEYI